VNAQRADRSGLLVVATLLWIIVLEAAAIAVRVVL
jgi:hypothetical protein